MQDGNGRGRRLVGGSSIVPYDGPDECRRRFGHRSWQVTTKRGARSLYYEADLRMAWEATGAKTTTAGVLRVYNIEHETRFQLGGDPNTSYMYQLGWSPEPADAWVERMRAEAAELFDAVSGAVTESAGAHSYYSISTGMQTGTPPAVPFLTPVSKSVLYTLCSVKKCLIPPTLCQNVSYTLYIASKSVLLTRSPCFPRCPGPLARDVLLRHRGGCAVADPANAYGST